MDDVLTLPPPPSRFFPDDLDVFARPPPPRPPPFVVLPSDALRRPYILLVAVSAPSIQLFLPPSQTLFQLAGTLIHPELPISDSSNLYTFPSSFPNRNNLILLLHGALPLERARDAAKALLSSIQAEHVVILDSILSHNFRGRLSADEPLAFKLETSVQRRSSSGVAISVDYLPSGSVMDGLGAALLGECEKRRLKGTLLGTWPGRNADPAVLRLLSFLLQRDILPGSGFLGHGVLNTASDLNLLYA